MKIKGGDMTIKSIALCGCGAIGSQLAMHLAGDDVWFMLVDDDRVSEGNIGTSAFYTQHVGASKALALGEMIYRKSNEKSSGLLGTVTIDNLRLVTSGQDLILDCFDNVESRHLLCGLSVPTLHVGVSRERTGAVMWDEDYALSDGAPRGQDQFCTHQAGKSIIRTTAAVAARIVEQFLETGVKRSVVVTEDFKLFE